MALFPAFAGFKIYSTWICPQTCVFRETSPRTLLVSRTWESFYSAQIGWWRQLGTFWITWRRWQMLWSAVSHSQTNRCRMFSVLCGICHFSAATAVIWMERFLLAFGRLNPCRILSLRATQNFQAVRKSNWRTPFFHWRLNRRFQPSLTPSTCQNLFNSPSQGAIFLALSQTFWQHCLVFGSSKFATTNFCRVRTYSPVVLSSRLTFCSLGTVPQAFGNSAALQNLELQNTNMSGPLPDFTNAFRLNVVAIGGVKWSTGAPLPVPAWISSLQSLSSLDISNCGWIGTISPTIFTSNPMLGYFNASANLLTGSRLCCEFSARSARF